MLESQTTIDLETILSEKKLAEEFVDEASLQIEQLEKDLDHAEKRIALLNAISERINNVYVEENLKIAIRRRNELHLRLSAEHDNKNGYKEIITVLELFEKKN